MEMSTTHILLVDDDSALLQSLPHAIALRMSGVQVQTAGDVSTALGLLQEQEYDVIVSDIMMPGMDGLELLNRVSERHPETPVLLITGHMEHDLAVRAIRGGAFDYILKPIDRDDFTASLQRALQARQLRRQIQVQQHALEWHALALERQVEQRNHELVEANANKDALLSTIAHALASPLASLKDMRQQIDQHLQQSAALEQIRHSVASMTDPLNQLEMLMRDLQDISLIQTNRAVFHPCHCDLVELCQRVLTAFTASGAPTPIFQASNTPLKAEVDPDRLSQMLLNLLTNAHKNSPEGGLITVQVQRSGMEAIISVQDQGLEIPVEELPRIAEQFYRVPGIAQETSTSTGPGLDLYLVQILAEQHGGHIEVQSHEEQGSTYSIVLPLLDE